MSTEFKMADKGQRPDDHRRKWDLSEYEKAAKMREDVEKAMNRFNFPTTPMLIVRIFILSFLKESPLPLRIFFRGVGLFVVIFVKTNLK